MSSAPDTRRRPHRVYWHPARDDLGNEKSVFKGGNCGPRGSRWVPKMAGYQRMVARAGEAAKFPFLISSHVLRHSCGYKLANDGQDTRAIQHYLGHRSIASTVRYTKLAPDRFRGFWKD
jgi:site-specific recombinase XerD